MIQYVFISLQDENKISVFTIDGETGKLTLETEVAVSDAPSGMAISPDRKFLYVGHRDPTGISSWRIDHSTGGLTQVGKVSTESWSAFMSTDRKGKFLLSAYYQAGHVGVHPIGDNGAVGEPPVEWIETDIGAHAIQTDPSNRFAFVPHIARLFDNVMEPPKDTPGPNVIFQFKFDEETGHLTPNSPLKLDPGEGLGPRYYCFHPDLNVVYFSDEQGCSVTAYNMDPSTGGLAAFQTITTLPDGYSGRNTCSQIQISPSGKFLYVPNRGHNSIAGFTVDASSGRLTAIGQAPTEAVPNAFSLDLDGKFIVAAGSASGGLASYRINGDTGELIPVETFTVGQRPAGVLITSLGD
ncbi:MAG: beta-propeller fold lactonase family protein [Chloroflexota bacterium]|nr:beta-propeller fold lactonase family protein [Chloroflexota bacterium]